VVRIRWRLYEFGGSRKCLILNVDGRQNRFENLCYIETRLVLILGSVSSIIFLMASPDALSSIYFHVLSHSARNHSLFQLSHYHIWVYMGTTTRYTEYCVVSPQLSPGHFFLYFCSFSSFLTTTIITISGGSWVLVVEVRL